MKTIKILAITAMMLVCSMAAAQNNKETQQMLDRFLKYASIASQSTYPANPEEEFPINPKQKEIANLVYNEVKAFGKGVEVWLSPDYYLYIKVESNMDKSVPTLAFMAHLDETPEINAIGRKLQVIKNYDGKDIPLGKTGLVLSPDSVQGLHLNDVVGHTIVTSDGTTNTGADDKSGCAILVSLVETLVKDRSISHGTVWVLLCQNEDVGLSAYRIDTSYFGATAPEIMIDVDGDDVWRYSVTNFSAKGYNYLFHGNQRHPGNGFENGLVDAQTAYSFFIGQIPPDANPMFSSGEKGYLQAYIIDNLGNGDYRVKFRARYFKKSDSTRYAEYLRMAETKTLEAFPGIEITKESEYLQYENVAFSMNPHTIPVIERAIKKIGLKLEPEQIRAGTTGAMCVARGLPGAPCLYAAQQNPHTIYEWCSIEEMVALKHLCLKIVEEIAEL